MIWWTILTCAQKLTSSQLSLPKIGCHGNDPFSLVYGSVTHEFHDSRNPISKPNSAWICCIQLKLWPFMFFSLFWPKFDCHGNVPYPCNQKCFIWIGRPRKPPVITNHILVVSHRNAFICIYSNFSPKIGCHCNTPLSFVYWSVTDEFPWQSPISKPNSAWMCRLQLKLWPFLWFFGLFWPKFGCHGNVP